MECAAIYARYSSESQNVASIQQQIDACREYADSHDMRISHVYSDRAISGRHMDRRTGLDKMLCDIAKNKFKYVLVWKMDRLARNRYDAAQIRAKLKRYGIKLISITENIGNGPESIILESVLDGIAEYYSEQLSQNVKRGIRANALQCNHNGRRIYGYVRLPNGKYGIDTQRAEIVHALFIGALNGVTVRNTLSKFDARICPSISHASTIIRDASYTGLYSYNGVTVKDGMPQIIDKELFDSVQSIIAKRRHKHRQSKYVLSGLLYTLDGTRLKSASGTSRNGITHTYYRNTVTYHWYPTEKLESAIFDACTNTLLHHYAITDIESKLSDRVNESERKNLELQLSNAQANYNRILTLCADMLPSDDLTNRLELIAQSIEKLRALLSTHTDSPNYHATVKAICNAKLTDWPNLIDRVFVADNGMIFIYFCLDKTKEPPKYLDGSTLFAVVRHTGFKNNDAQFSPFYVVLRDALIVLTRL